MKRNRRPGPVPAPLPLDQPPARLSPEAEPSSDPSNSSVPASSTGTSPNTLRARPFPSSAAAAAAATASGAAAGSVAGWYARQGSRFGTQSSDALNLLPPGTSPVLNNVGSPVFPPMGGSPPLPGDARVTLIRPRANDLVDMTNAGGASVPTSAVGGGDHRLDPDNANADKAQVRVEGFFEQSEGLLIPSDLPRSTVLYVLTASDGRDLMFKLVQYTLQLNICFLLTDGLFPPESMPFRMAGAQRFLRNYNTIRHGRSLFKMGRGLLNFFTLVTVCQRLWLKHGDGFLQLMRPLWTGDGLVARAVRYLMPSAVDHIRAVSDEVGNASFAGPQRRLLRREETENLLSEDMYVQESTVERITSLGNSFADLDHSAARSPGLSRLASPTTAFPRSGTASFGRSPIIAGGQPQTPLFPGTTARQPLLRAGAGAASPAPPPTTSATTTPTTAAAVPQGPLSGSHPDDVFLQPPLPTTPTARPSPDSAPDSAVKGDDKSKSSYSAAAAASSATPAMGGAGAAREGTSLASEAATPALLSFTMPAVPPGSLPPGTQSLLKPFDPRSDTDYLHGIRTVNFADSMADALRQEARREDESRRRMPSRSRQESRNALFLEEVDFAQPSWMDSDDEGERRKGSGRLRRGYDDDEDDDDDSSDDDRDPYTSKNNMAGRQDTDTLSGHSQNYNDSDVSMTSADSRASSPVDVALLVQGEGEVPSALAQPARWKRAVTDFNTGLMMLLGVRVLTAGIRRCIRDVTLISAERFFLLPWVEQHRPRLHRATNLLWLIVSAIDLLLNTLRLAKLGWVKYATARQNIRCRCGCRGADDPDDMVWRANGFLTRRKTNIFFPPLDLDYGAPYASNVTMMEAADPIHMMPACSRCGCLYREVPDENEGGSGGAQAASQKPHWLQMYDEEVLKAVHSPGHHLVSPTTATGSGGASPYRFPSSPLGGSGGPQGGSHSASSAFASANAGYGGASTSADDRTTAPLTRQTTIAAAAEPTSALTEGPSLLSPLRGGPPAATGTATAPPSPQVVHGGTGSFAAVLPESGSGSGSDTSDRLRTETTAAGVTASSAAAAEKEKAAARRESTSDDSNDALVRNLTPQPRERESIVGFLLVPWLMRRMFNYIWLLRVHPNWTSTLLLQARYMAELFLAYKFCFGGYESGRRDAPLESILRPKMAVAGMVSAFVGLLRVIQSAPK